MKPERITKIHHIISELDVLISELKEKGNEKDVQRCSDVRLGYIEDLKKMNITDYKYFNSNNLSELKNDIPSD